MNDIDPILLMLGPAGAVGLYWTLYRHYRNTDKSHAYERDTQVHTQPITGLDLIVDKVEGTRDSSIRGNNVHAHRKRVNHMLKKTDR